MNGSEKQIKWAEDIKASKMEDFLKLRSMCRDELGTKIVDYVLSLDHAAYWIDNRNKTPISMMETLLTTGLWIWGSCNDRIARFDPATSSIIITWEEIVEDGKGGHKEKRTETIKL